MIIHPLVVTVNMFQEQYTGRMLIERERTCDALRGPRSGRSRGEVVTVLVRRIDLNIEGIQ